MNQKTIGLLIMVAGTGIAAAFGSQNLDAVTEEESAKLRAATYGDLVAEALTDYCKIAHEDTSLTALKTGDGCPPGLSAVPVEVLVAKLTTAVPAARPDGLPDNPALIALRDGWVAAERSAVRPRAELAALYKDVSDDDAYNAAKEAADAANRSVQAAKKAYCGFEPGKDEAIKALFRAEGCIKKRLSPYVTDMLALAAGMMDAKAHVALPRKKKPLETLLADKVGGVDALKAKIAERHESLRMDKRTTMIDEGRAAVDASRGKTVPHVEGLAVARDKWLALRMAAVGPNAIAATLPKPPPPSDRVSGWIEGPGLIWLLGILLIIVGVVISRKARRAEAVALTGGSERGAGPRAIDFGDAIDALIANLRALHERMVGTTGPTAQDQEEIKAQLEGFARDQIEPMVDARDQLIVRYGMAGFAEVFGPFSGGERYINRAWATLVDRHWEETMSSIERAEARFKEAREALDSVVAASKKVAA